MKKKDLTDQVRKELYRLGADLAGVVLSKRCSKTQHFGRYGKT